MVISYQTISCEHNNDRTSMFQPLA